MGAAIISDCGTYRYTLTRSRYADERPDRGTALWCMLNPSTANAEQDDATIRRCRGFAHDWKCNGLTVVNLYALRATDPNELWKHEDPVGPDNDHHLRTIACEYGDVLCAWGANAKPERVKAVIAIFKEAGARMWCLGTTKHGMPKHPLYIAADTKPVRWSPA